MWVFIMKLFVVGFYFLLLLIVISVIFLKCVFKNFYIFLVVVEIVINFSMCINFYRKEIDILCVCDMIWDFFFRFI